MNARLLRRALLPIGVFAAVLAVHFVWSGLHPECAPGAEVCECEEQTWTQSYVASQSYWLGLSYGTSLAFAATMFRRWRERASASAGKMALGGVTFSGVLAVAGCWLVGCCGSPMLGVWVSLLGAAFVPWAKPLAFGLTVVSISAASWWMLRREQAMAIAGSSCTGAACGCSPTATPMPTTSSS